jgi:ABC-type multidrug transport system permease subunit
MVYFGPAYPDSIQFLNPPAPGAQPSGELSPEMLLSGVSKKSSAEWQQIYQASRYKRDFVDARSGKQPSGTEKTAGYNSKRHFDLTQWFALVKRNTIVKLRDRTQTTILLLQAPLFAALIVMVYHGLDAGMSPDVRQELTKKLVGIHFLMVVAAIWFGCNNAARDIVGEWTVYKRERMVTLKLGSYVFSKLAVLFGLALVQCLSLLGIVFLSIPLKGSFLLDFLVLVLSTLVGTGLGLCISAISKTTESAIALLPVVLLPIIALGGGLRPAYVLDSKVRWVTRAVPSQWALEANLLQEVGEGEGKWKMVGAPMAPGALNSHAPDGQGAENTCRARAGAANSQYSDVVSGIIPRYQIDCPDQDGTMRENFTSQPIEVTYGDKSYKATSFRHSFFTSLMVLSGMLTLLVVGVLGILRKRDSDPQ